MKPTKLYYTKNKQGAQQSYIYTHNISMLVLQRQDELQNAKSLLPTSITFSAVITANE